MDSSCDGSIDFDRIVLDSPEAVGLEFTSDKFEGCLLRRGKTVYIWLIRSKNPGRGHFSRLMQNVLDAGYSLKIPTPLARMTEIVRRKGFARMKEYGPDLEELEVWVKEPVHSTPLEDLERQSASR
jgi:hypothetical protein